MVKVSPKLRKLGRPEMHPSHGAHTFLVLSALTIQVAFLAFIPIFILDLMQDTQFAHHHPRMMLLIKPAAVVFWFFFCTSFMAIIWPSKWQRRGTLRRPSLKLHRYLNYSFEKNYPLFADQAWETVVDSLRSFAVKTPDTRLAVWEVKQLHAQDKCARFELRYVRTTLGQKVSRLYPRTIECEVRLLGTGISTLVDVRYQAHSSMDYQIVQTMIDQTNAEIERALSEVSCFHELATIRQSKAGSTGLTA